MPTPRRQARQERRRHLLVERLAKAKRPSERVAAAHDYLRAELRDAPPDKATAAADAVVDYLTTIADQLSDRSKS